MRVMGDDPCPPQAASRMPSPQHCRQVQGYVCGCVWAWVLGVRAGRGVRMSGVGRALPSQGAGVLLTQLFSSEL